MGVVGSAIVVACVLGSGCGPAHVHLTPLPPNPDPGQRVALYQQYRRAGVVTNEQWSCTGAACQVQVEHRLLLANGVTVEAPGDVLPLFPADSATARAASRFERARHHRNLFTTGFMGAGIAGGVMWVDSQTNGNGSEQVAGVTLLLAAVACLVGDVVESRAMSHQADTVIVNYDRDLARELRVCTRGFAIVPCEASGPPGETPKAPDPALGSLRQR